MHTVVVLCMNSYTETTFLLYVPRTGKTLHPFVSDVHNKDTAEELCTSPPNSSSSKLDVEPDDKKIPLA